MVVRRPRLAKLTGFYYVNLKSILLPAVQIYLYLWE